MTSSIYLKDAAAGAFRALQVGGSVPSTATTGTGWVVATTAATAYSQMASNTERAASTFGATAMPPDSGPDSALGDGFRSENVINGRFAAGSWTIPIPVIRVTAGTTADGRVRVRLWRSPNADGSAATEITSGAQAGTTVTNLTNVEQISTVTVSLGEFGLVDEYLFLSVAWEITGAGGGATDDVNIQVGASGTITATTLTVATLTEYWAVLAGQGLVFSKKNYVRQMAQAFAAQVSSESAGVRLGESVTSIPNWAGGSGYPNYDSANPTRYYQAYGADPTATKDKLQAGLGLTASLSSARNAQRVFGLYNSQLYVGASTGQVARQTATDTWTDPVGTITSNREVTAIAEAGQSVNTVTARMWVANRTNAQLASYDGTTFTNNAADANIGANALSRVTALGSWTTAESINTFIVGGKRSASNQALFALVRSTSWAAEWIDQTGTAGSSDLSDVGYPDITAFLVASDGHCYWCAGDTSAIKGQVIQSSSAVVSGAGTTIYPFAGAMAIPGYLADDYITAFAELSGVVYGLGAIGRLYKIESDKLVLIASNISPVSTQTLYGMTVWNSALWISCRVGTAFLVRRYGPSDPNDSTSALVWSDPIYGGAIDASATAARQVVSFGGYLYAATEASGASKIYRMDKAVYSTSPVTVQTGEITFDSAVIVKSVKVEHSALVASDSVQLKYSRNGSATFNSLGTNSTVGSTSTSYPVAASGQVTRLSVQAVITAGSSAATPQLGQMTIVVRPIGEVTREWTINVQMFGTATKPDKRKDGTDEPHTGQVIDDTLWQIFEEGVTQRYRDVDGDIYTVTVADFSDHPQEELSHVESLRWTGGLKLKEV